MKNIISVFFLILLSACSLFGQNKQASVTDVNTPLHLLPPDYPVPYGPVRSEDAIALLNRIYAFLETASPAKITDLKTKDEITDLKNLTPGSVFKPGVFRLISYEWGVAYGAMLMASEATGDHKFRDYTVNRMNLISDITEYFRAVPPADLQVNNPVRSVLDPQGSR